MAGTTWYLASLFTQWFCFSFLSISLPCCVSLFNYQGDEKEMKCDKEVCKKWLGRTPQQDFCDICNGLLGYHAEEY